MRFDFEYRTSDNVRHSGTVVAADRESAFDKLKRQGIRPGRLVEAPGLFNKLFGKGKRWLAIVILAVVSGAAWWKIIGNGEDDCLARSQIYGDIAQLEDAAGCGWCNVFSDVGDAYLARHAIPGVRDELPYRRYQLDEIAKALLSRAQTHVDIGKEDVPVHAQMKRMVNGMKRELSEYLAAGGSVEKYMIRLDRRIEDELGIYERTRRTLMGTKDRRIWAEMNETLRSRGLKTVPRGNQDF